MTGASNKRGDEASDSESGFGRATILSAVILLIPPGLALGAAGFPGYIPAPFVDLASAREARTLLFATGVVLFVVNAGILWLMWRNARDVA